MRSQSEKIPDPKELEKEIGEFLSKKFGNNVKIVTPMILPQEGAVDKVKEPPRQKKKIKFDLKPEELIAYLDQFVVKQDSAKAILATKICTHFNRIKRAQAGNENSGSVSMVGHIKNLCYQTDRQ
jgi:ATP-dependent protease Clp ATPase subunit